MKLKKSAQKYLELLKGERPWTENEIKYFRKQLNACSTLTKEEQDYLLDQWKGDYDITSEQSNKGINYLKNSFLKLNREPRKNCKLGSYELDVIKDFSHFKFVDLYNGNEYNNFYVPVYRCYSKNGDYFDYTGVCKERIIILG